MEFPTTSLIKISVVSYLNSKPFMYGLKQAHFKRPVEIQEDIPSICARKVISGEVQIGLIPIAVLPEILNPKIISNYCIGADGIVNSVLLLSQVPLNEIKTILLDYQSRTSVLLTKILSKLYWKIQPRWQQTEAEYENQIVDQTAGVVIGDRALLLKDKFQYAYDLSDQWKIYTGRPFVFACWVSNLELDKEFISDFNDALQLGLNNIPVISANEKTSELSEKEISDYLKNSIDYIFDKSKQEAMAFFLELSKEVN